MTDVLFRPSGHWSAGAADPPTPGNLGAGAGGPQGGRLKSPQAWG